MKEGILTDLDIFMPVFQAGDRIFHKQWDEFLSENQGEVSAHAQIFPLLPRAAPAFLSGFGVLFCATSTELCLEPPRANPGVSVPPAVQRN